MQEVLLLQCKEQVQTGGSMPNPRRLLHPEDDGSGAALIRPKARPAPGNGGAAMNDKEAVRIISIDDTPEMHEVYQKILDLR